MIDFSGHEITGDIISALSEALVAGANNIAEQSKGQVPEKTGALKDNCKVEVEDELTVTVGYDLPYAVIQHEDLNVGHEKGKAKFLEEPFYDECKSIVEAAAKAVMRAIE